MYIPRHFEVTDEREIYAFIESNAFGQLITNVAGRPFSTHIPFLLSGDRTRLTGHIARQNPQASSVEGQEVLVTLQGPHDGLPALGGQAIVKPLQVRIGEPAGFMFRWFRQPMQPC